MVIMIVLERRKSYQSAFYKKGLGFPIRNREGIFLDCFKNGLWCNHTPATYDV